MSRFFFLTGDISPESGIKNFKNSKITYFGGFQWPKVRGKKKRM
jgi:hypothetical protein